jgi:tRNA pseudouridine55 synthase
MNSILFVWKPLGWTPLKAVTVFKEKNPEYKNATISYAGRLDPMAEGLLLLLVEDQNKKRKEYEGLKKTYVIEMVFGLSSDTYDALGVIEKVNAYEMDNNKVENALHDFIGRQKQVYPPYSSKTVLGKPLYWWARTNRISEIELPTREIEIKSITQLTQKRVSVEKICQKMIKAIQRVDGDFRQQQIIASWKKVCNEQKGSFFDVLKLEIECSSGTYMRRLVYDIGVRLGCGALCLSIRRTKLGDHLLKDSIRLA